MRSCERKDVRNDKERENIVEGEEEEEEDEWGKENKVVTFKVFSIRLFFRKPLEKRDFLMD
jgi:hypothetical protein